MSQAARGHTIVVVLSLNHVWFFATPWTAAYQAPLSTISQSLLRFMSTELAMLSNHLIFRCLLLLLPSIFPSIRVFSSESALCTRWPALTSVLSTNIQGWFSLGLTGLISSRPRTLKSLLQHHNSVLWCSAFFRSNCHIHTWLLYKLLKWRKDFQIYFVLFQLLWWQILYIFKYGIALYIC